jgi:hypothetical protein
MRVICVGLNRTGTTSLTLALEELGFGPCYHIRTLNSEPHRVVDWITAERDPALADWKRIFRGFDSAVGSPASAFWREITDEFNYAKVILTVRPADGWYESVAATLNEALAPEPAAVRLLTWQRPSQAATYAKASDEFQQRILQREVGGDFSDRERTIKAFDKHIADVKARIQADRLLVYSVRDGWGPLCTFLGVPEPDRPFPRENDRATYRRRLRAARNDVLIPRLLTMTGVVAGLALLAVWLRRAGRIWQ